jgi:hypothetical protein
MLRGTHYSSLSSHLYTHVDVCFAVHAAVIVFGVCSSLPLVTTVNSSESAYHDIVKLLARGLCCSDISSAFSTTCSSSHSRSVQYDILVSF